MPSKLNEETESQYPNESLIKVGNRGAGGSLPAIRETTNRTITMHQKTHKKPSPKRSFSKSKSIRSRDDIESNKTFDTSDNYEKQSMKTNLPMIESREGKYSKNTESIRPDYKVMKTLEPSPLLQQLKHDKSNDISRKPNSNSSIREWKNGLNSNMNGLDYHLDNNIALNNKNEMTNGIKKWEDNNNFNGRGPVLPLLQSNSKLKKPDFKDRFIVPENFEPALPKLSLLKNYVPQSDFIAEMEKLDLDPQYYKLYVAFLKDGADDVGRRLYAFHVKKATGTVMDLKKIIQNEFGYDVRQQKVYRGYKEIVNNAILSGLKDFENEIEILLLARAGTQAQVPHMHSRSKIPEVIINDIIDSNSSNISQEEFLNMNADETLIWPPFRNWTMECQELLQKISFSIKLVESNEATIETIDMSNLMNLEVEYVKLMSDFEKTMSKCAHIIINWKIQPVNIDNIYGKGGTKWIMGGIIIRECKDWLLACESVGDGDIAYKVADNELKGLNLLRGKIDYLELPMAGIVDYYGVRFLAQSLTLLAKTSLVYGSNTEGIIIYSEGEGVEIANQVSSIANIRNVSEISNFFLYKNTVFCMSIQDKNMKKSGQKFVRSVIYKRKNKICLD